MRVERLQDISPDDVIAEGCFAIGDGGIVDGDATVGVHRDLWESINGPGTWEANPWVWVIEFRRLPQ